MGAGVVGAAARKLTGAALKSFAHPLRLRIYELLEEHGPLTATKLAGLLDENTGATSYHLRELARHDMIEIAEGLGRGKEKYWRITPGGFSTGEPWKEPDAGAVHAAQLLIDRTLGQRAEELARWRQEAASTPEEWVRGSVLGRRSLRLTSAEMHEMASEVLEVLDRFRVAAERRESPAETARVVVHFDVFPVGVTEGGSGGGVAQG
ncbi:helix-turn-helix domain-containing protein [Nonomuraea sp. NPDC050310]|uniref:ArsR/SmtB family transcription factor n=1 Tax=Nonomuraea sp. NPDC050310 TaxID=3154935 RepID=UPI0033D0D58D